MKRFCTACLLFLTSFAALLFPVASHAVVCGTWKFVPSPSPAAGTSTLSAVGALSSSDAWAAGIQFTTAEINGIQYDVTKTLTMHWNGVAWSIVPSPNPSTLPEQNILRSVAAIASDDVWAVGSHNDTEGTGGPVAQTMTLHWNGSVWSVVPSPLIVIASLSGGSSFDAVSALASNDVWAVGLKAMSSPGPDEAPLVARWDGSTWNQIAAPYVGNRINRLQGVSARTTSDVWAVGTWRSASTTFHILIEHWNGSAWSISPAPDPGNNDQLLAVEALSTGNVWAVGERNDPAAGLQPLIMHWNGSSWSVQSLPTFPGDFNRLNALRAISATDIWAAGASAPVPGGPQQALLMHWDGVDWTTVSAGSTGGSSEYFNGLGVVGACDVWAVGSFLNPAAMAPLAERLRSSQTVATVAPYNAASLEQNSPNPFNPTTMIRFTLPARERVVLSVYDTSGRLIRTLVDETRNRGTHEVTWDGRDGAGSTVGSGVYFYRLTAGNYSASRRMVLLK